VTAAVEAVGVSCVYPDGTQALDQVTFAVAHGEAVGLVGPSGAGKTTLLMAFVGFMRLAAGEIRVMGARVERQTLRDVRRRVGLVFQNPDDQLFMPTVFEDVAFGPQNQGVIGKDLERCVQEALEDRGLLGLENRPPGHLSFGQKRLASLAAVLVMQPDVLLLDEPSSNLDPRARRQLADHLNGLGAARLLASHDLELVLDVCTRVVVLDGGRVVAEGDPVEIMSNEAMMEAHGLEVPHSLVPHGEGHRHAPRSRRIPWSPRPRKGRA
jgi:cobalt/nickel transport system ATP-binding protein